MTVSGDRYRRIRICRRHGIAERQGLYLHHHAIYALFDEMIHRPWGGVRWNPALDVREDKDAFTITVDLPGVKGEDAQVVVEGKILAIEGERKLPQCDETTTHLCERPDGRFVRTFEFENDINDRGIESHWEDGVLTVTIPKTKERIGS
jgi:HSP20 family molecular chaperone IbpA